MAGDWIKVEHSTPDKPEVLRIAELLGISRRECLGLLVDFWRWIDANARADVVPNLSRQCLDSVLNCPGFSAAYEAVGWIEWDDKNASARIVNFDNHHSQSAKTRAYEQKKKKRQRENVSRICPDETGTREEKRRDIDTSLRSVSKARPKKRGRIDAPTEEHERIAAERGVSCQAEFEKYRDWQAANGKHHSDEVAGFRNWLRGARSARPANDELIARKLQAARNMDILTGKVTDGRERIVAAERVDSAPVFALPGRIREPGGDDVEGCRPAGGAIAMGG